MQNVVSITPFKKSQQAVQLCQQLRECNVRRNRAAHFFLQCRFIPPPSPPLPPFMFLSRLPLPADSLYPGTCLYSLFLCLVLFFVVRKHHKKAFVLNTPVAVSLRLFNIHPDTFETLGPVIMTSPRSPSPTPTKSVAVGFRPDVSFRCMY
ncbi:hypothetical protein B0T22DRAFT_230392 [Podospora appendiculata]|uniref:Uncharacterized protein n=1 Tax=Podospora appendiculata TaxID=314037 RepID=A0AAE0X6F2_9PEZI|nr:hypothetical protein B0T22DRAFT_230392 [Podospora appendiculata]